MAEEALHVDLATEPIVQEIPLHFSRTFCQATSMTILFGMTFRLTGAGFCLHAPVRD